ncbi:leucine carboxyl methyltransferase [Epithele typhae]|uniref:leucine carboxyl methyltransferase n=1 Tax=Epithele typhae TaxID=378194 RepID=UPI002007815E|nr:leucine carboxyl methyltransferase [Epithele typhae]KAH9942177.1 leucine carboxyl methyltransferase [Epithele typhae]
MYHPSGRAPGGDSAIRATDGDAVLARFSAVQRGYLADPFLAPFVPRAHLQPPRPPLINIGTYVRSEAVDGLLGAWLARCPRGAQVVSLGAGSDTRFWRLAAGPRKDAVARYVEIDFPENTTKKAMAIRKHAVLHEPLGGLANLSFDNGGTTVHSPVYHLLATDLRRPPSETLEPLLAPLLDPTLPTVLLFECVLAYMEPADSTAVLKWFTDFFSALAATEGGAVLGCIVYEMFALEDAFGSVMRNHLAARNISLPGVKPYPTVESLPKRFTDIGWQTAKALTLKDIRREYVPSAELERMSRLEMLDEIEELDLTLAHYAVTWGVKLPPQTDQLRVEWDTWGLHPKTDNAEDDS